MRPFAKISRLFTALVIAIIAAAPPALADEGSGAKKIDVAPQPLASALQAFSEQSGLQVAYVATLAENVTSKGTDDARTPSAALEEILENTGLEYQFVNADTVAIGLAATSENEAEDPGNSRPASSPVLIAQNQTSAPRHLTNETSNDDEDEEAPKMEEIVVTGTNIRGVSPDSSPSFIYNREDIDKTGFGTVPEFVQSLPQNFGGGSQANTLLTGGGLPNDRTAALNKNFGSSVNLRGLGSGSTLVLLNGSRLAPTGLIGDFVDISMIPLSAVERVEVLTDGASAIYGADAIAGVVNFVLRDDYDGAESFVRYGSVTDGDLNEYRVGQILGNSWDSGNALVSYEFFHRDNLGAEDRDFSSNTPLPSDLLPEQESHNVLLTASQQLSDRIRLRGHGTFSQRDGAIVNTLQNGRMFFEDARTKQHGGSAGADIELWDDWLLDVSGSHHKVIESKDRTGDFTSQFETDSDLWSVDGKADGTVFRIPGGGVKIAAGLSYREEFFSAARPDLAFLLREDTRSVFSGFGEAFIPIVGADNGRSGIERLELTVAGRYDDYSDFGGTFNPKVGLLWSPTDGLNFRGTFSTSFNPPNLGDTGGRSGDVAAANAPNPASPTGESLVILDRRSTRDLNPESSTTWTAGLDYQNDVGPGAFDLSITWFDIGYEDRIGRAGEAFFFLTDPVVFVDVIIPNPDPALTASIIADAIANEFGFSNFSGFGGSPLWMMPGDEEFIFLDKLLNLATTDTSGLDFDLTYVIDADIGQLNFGVNSTYLLKQEKRITAAAPTFDVVDTVFNPVDLRVRGSASWSRSGFTASTFVNYVDSYVDDRNLLGTGDVPVGSWTTVDVNLSYDTGVRPEDNLIDNTRFSLSVLDLFNQEPPTVGSAFGSGTGYDPTNASALGRFISLQITTAW